MTNADILALDVDWDIVTGMVSVMGRTLGREMLQPNLQDLLPLESEQFAFAEMSKGDERPIDLRLLRNGEPVELELTSLRYAIKEFDTGLLYPLNAEDGLDLVQVVKNGEKRWRIPIHFESSRMIQILQKYADPGGTFTDVITEMQLTCPYDLEQTEGAQSGPALLQMAAGDSATLTADIPLDLADGESASYFINAEVEGVARTAMAGIWGDFSLSAEERWRNFQNYRVTIPITVSRSGGAYSIDSGGVPSVPTRNFTQFDRQYVVQAAWIDSVTFSAVIPTPDGLRVTCDVDVETIDNDFLGNALAANGWVSDIEMSRTSWDNYGRASNVNDRYKLNTGGSGLIWRDFIQIYLVNEGVEQLALQIDYEPLYLDQEMARPYSGGGDTFYIMAPEVIAGGYPTIFRNKFRLFFPAEPAAGSVRIRYDGDPSTDADFAIQPISIPQQIPVQLTAEIPGQGVEEPEGPRECRLSTSSFVTRLRRDLNPDEAPDGSGGA